MNRRLIFLVLIFFSFSLFAEMKLSYNPKLRSFWIDYFTKRQKQTFLRFVKNGNRYKNSVESILKEHGLPKELFYVALIESGFNLKVKSRAGAKGPWQFMRGTAKRYGLRVDNSVDERVNILKATHAAAEYFKDLYNIFGSWELALCAYNAGEYKIIRAIRKGNTRDYRKLVAKRLLPKETIYYIPKVVAARMIVENPRKYGMRLPARMNNTLFEKAGARRVSGRFELRHLAKKWNVRYADLKRLNPDILHKRVRARRGMKIYIPNGERKFVPIQISENPPTKYTVKKGDTLIGISSRFNLSLGDLIRHNKIRKYRIYSGQKLIIRQDNYIVRAGDNLEVIARRFKTSVRELRSLNSLQGSRIYPRQKLVIPTKI